MINNKKLLTKHQTTKYFVMLGYEKVSYTYKHSTRIYDKTKNFISFVNNQTFIVVKNGRQMFSKYIRDYKHIRNISKDFEWFYHETIFLR